MNFANYGRDYQSVGIDKSSPSATNKAVGERNGERNGTLKGPRSIREQLKTRGKKEE